MGDYLHNEEDVNAQHEVWNDNLVVWDDILEAHDVVHDKDHDVVHDVVHDRDHDEVHDGILEAHGDA